MTMDVPALAWPLSWRTSSLLIALMCVAGQGQDDKSSCTPTIRLPGGLKYEKSRGESLDLKCPVSACTRESPNVSWCKIDEGQQDTCELLGPDSQMSFSWEKPQGNEAAHVLHFHSIHINDSGYYKCAAQYTEQQIMGSIIEVIVSAEPKTETTAAQTLLIESTAVPATPSMVPVVEQFRVLLYVVASAGALCVIIITVSLAVFCYRRRRKMKRSPRDPELAEEVQYVATPVNPENVLDNGKSLSPPGKMLTTTVTAETTYDNAHLCRVPSAPMSPEEDSIVYADLNHNAKKTHFQFTENDEVEYATVHLH